MRLVALVLASGGLSLAALDMLACRQQLFRFKDSPFFDKVV